MNRARSRQCTACQNVSPLNLPLEEISCHVDEHSSGTPICPPLRRRKYCMSYDMRMGAIFAHAPPSIQPYCTESFRRGGQPAGRMSWCHRSLSATILIATCSTIALRCTNASNKRPTYFLKLTDWPSHGHLKTVTCCHICIADSHTIESKFYLRPDT